MTPSLNTASYLYSSRDRLIRAALFFKIGFNLIVLSLLSMPAWAGSTIRVCADNDNNFPLAASEQHSPARPGILIEIIRQAAAAENVALELIFAPWKRCNLLMLTGQTDAMLASANTPDRAGQSRFPSASEAYIWLAEYPLFVKKVHQPTAPSLQWDGERLSGPTKNIYAEPGLMVRDKLRQLGAVVPPNIVLNNAPLMVARGRLDGFVTEVNIGWQLLANQNLQDELETLPVPVLQVPWYVPVSRQFYDSHPELVERLWQRIALVRRENTARFIDVYRLKSTPTQ